MAHAYLARGANPDPKDVHDKTPLFVASALGHTAVVEILLIVENLLIVEILLKTSQVNPNIQHCRTGETPLWKAARQGHMDIVRSLIAQGAIMQNRYQPTPEGHRLRRGSKEQK